MPVDRFDGRDEPLVVNLESSGTSLTGVNVEFKLFDRSRDEEVEVFRPTAAGGGGGGGTKTFSSFEGVKRSFVENSTFSVTLLRLTEQVEDDRLLEAEDEEVWELPVVYQSSERPVNQGSIVVTVVVVTVFFNHVGGRA